MANGTTIPLADQQHIYRVLSDRFPFDKPIPMATVSYALIEADIDKEAFGFKKMKSFLAEMDSFLSFTDILAGGVPQRLVTLRKREDWAAPAPSEPEAEHAGTTEAEGAPTPAETRPCGPSGRAPDDLPSPAPDGPGAPFAPAGSPSAPHASQTPSASDPKHGAIPRGIRDELRPELGDFVYLPEQTLDILRAAIPAGTDARTLLADSWRRAFQAGGLRYYEGKVLFPLSATRSDGTTPIEVSIRHVTYSNPEEKPWYLSYVDTYVRTPRPRSVPSPSQALQRFARLGPLSSFLGELAELALPERWDFDEPQEGVAPRYAILKSYITTTFYRLRLEDKICVDDAGTFAAFNTGLFTRRYDDIYACFEPQQGQGAIPWRFVGFCTQGSRALGKRLVSLFNPLPEPASYFESKNDLLYDLERDLIVDYDHVLVDNIARLPLAFLREELGGEARLARLLDKAQAVREECEGCEGREGREGHRGRGVDGARADGPEEGKLGQVAASREAGRPETEARAGSGLEPGPEGQGTRGSGTQGLGARGGAGLGLGGPEARGEAGSETRGPGARSEGADRYEELMAQVGRIVQDNPRLFRRLRWRVDDAVDVAKRRVRWNFKTAIPSYYPRANTMSLLLPLCLLEDGEADVALVVQLMPSGNYQGQTILTMRQAYVNARLICRPDSDWLTTVGHAGVEVEEPWE